MIFFRKFSLIISLSSIFSLAIAGFFCYYFIRLHLQDTSYTLFSSESASLGNFIGSIKRELGDEEFNRWILGLKEKGEFNFGSSIFFDNDQRSYQLWKDGQLIARTSYGPEIEAPTYDSDLIFKDDKGTNWLVSNKRIMDQNLWISLAVDIKTHKEPTGLILLTAFIPFVLIIPILLLAIFFLTDKYVYKPLKDFNNRLSENLDLRPFEDIKSWPVDIIPLIDNVNKIFYKIKYLKNQVDRSLENEKKLYS